MKIWVVTTHNPDGYVGTRASKQEAIDLVHEKYPHAFSIGDMTYRADDMLVVVYEDELPDTK